MPVRNEPIPLRIRLMAIVAAILDAIPFATFLYISIVNMHSFFDLLLGLTYTIIMFSIPFALSIFLFNFQRMAHQQKTEAFNLNAGTIMHASLILLSLPLFMIRSHPQLAKAPDYTIFVITFFIVNVSMFFIFFSLRRFALNRQTNAHTPRHLTNRSTRTLPLRITSTFKCSSSSSPLNAPLR